MRTHRHPVHSVDASPVHTPNECLHDQTSYRWVILVLLWLLYVAFGLAMRSVAPLVTPILRDLDLSYTEMGIILGSWQLTYIPVSIIAGTIVDRWGARKSLFAGTLAVGISLALRSLPRDFGGMLGAVGLLGGRWALGLHRLPQDDFHAVSGQEPRHGNRRLLERPLGRRAIARP